MYRIKIIIEADTPEELSTAIDIVKKKLSKNNRSDAAKKAWDTIRAKKSLTS